MENVGLKVDLINRTSLLNRINESINEFILTSDNRDIVIALKFMKLLVLIQEPVDIRDAYNVIKNAGGYME